MKRRQIVEVSDEDRIRFAIRLAAGPDIGRLKERPLRSVWREARAFMGLRESSGQTLTLVDRTGRTVVGPRDARFDGAFCRSVLLEFQRAARELFDRLREDLRANQEWRALPRGVDVPLTGLRLVGHFGRPDTLAFAAVDNMPAVFHVTLAALLVDEPGTHVRVCPECGSLFVRVRRQKYCSEKCTDRAVWKNYPAEKKLAARRKQYDKYNWTVGARSKHR